MGDYADSNGIGRNYTPAQLVRFGEPYPATHINWSKCADWGMARSALRGLFPDTTLYGNFAEPRLPAAEVKARCERAGFEVWQDPNDPNDIRLARSADSKSA